MAERDTMFTKITGSCACGKIRFTANSKSRDTCYCYCNTCRKCSGAPYIAFTHFDKDQIEWQTPPDEWCSSSNAYRTFCSTCASTISMVYNGSGQVAISIGCIDDGIENVPKVSMCIYLKDKPQWADLPEGVPCYAEFSDSKLVAGSGR